LASLAVITTAGVVPIVVAAGAAEPSPTVHVLVSQLMEHQA